MPLDPLSAWSYEASCSEQGEKLSPSNYPSWKDITVDGPASGICPPFRVILVPNALSIVQELCPNCVLFSLFKLRLGGRPATCSEGHHPDQSHCFCGQREPQF